MHETLREVGLRFDHKVIEWLSKDSISFQIIGDNVDVHQKPRYMTTDVKARDFHWFQIYAVKNRVNADLSSGQQVGSFEHATHDMFIPTENDSSVVKKELIVLVLRVLVQCVPCLRIFQDLVPSHICHNFSKEMCQASEIVPLDVY
jgi:hypothetical protein